jgi:hypothetical protein
VTTYSYTLTEYKPDESWLIASTARDSVELDDGEDFYTWAREHWPSPRYVVKLDLVPFRWAARD